MTGWCPVHDKVYEAEDGLCPKCGTALVSDDAPEPQPIVIEHDGAPDVSESPPVPSTPGARRHAANVVTAAAAVLIAFVAGLAIPSAGPNGERKAGPREATNDLTVGVSMRSGEVALRLESFSQRGRQVVLRMTVPPVEGLELGRLRHAGVSFFDAAGKQLAVDEMAARTTTSGFILEGFVLPRADTHVAAVGIDYLSLAAHGEAASTVDLRGAWPATAAAQPRARTAEGRLNPGEGPAYSITGVVGWADRLEVGLDGPRDLTNWQYGAEFQLESGGASSTVTTLEGGPATYVVRFTGVPPDWRRVTLRMRVSGLSIAGPWAWRLPSG